MHVFLQVWLLAFAAADTISVVLEIMVLVLRALETDFDAVLVLVLVLILIVLVLNIFKNSRLSRWFLAFLNRKNDRQEISCYLIYFCAINFFYKSTFTF